MISYSKQNWNPGSIVKVGFMTLMVQAAIPTPGNYEPDAYLMSNSKGQNYLFVPHKGLHKYDGAANIDSILTFLA